MLRYPGCPITDVQARGIEDLIDRAELLAQGSRIEAQAQGLDDFIALFPEQSQQDMRQRAAAALKLSDALGMPFETVYRDLDLYRQEMYLHIKSTETFLQTVDRGIKTGMLSKQIERETAAFRALSPAEQEERKAEYKKKIAELNLEISRNADAIPANNFAKSAGDTVQSLALIGGGMIASGLAGLGAGVLTANPLIGSAAGSAVNFAINAPVYTNLAYADMVMAGIDDREILERNAGMTGSVQALTESLLGMSVFGNVPAVALKGLAAKTALRFLAKKVGTDTARKPLGKLIKESAFRQLALDVLAVKGPEVLMEGAEEAAQSLEGNALFLNAAREYEALLKKNLREELYQAKRDIAFQSLDWEQVYASLENPNESFTAGVAMALWMGGLGLGVRTAGLTMMDVRKTIGSLENIAQTTNSKEAFVEQAGKLPVLSPKAAERIYAELHETRPELFAFEDSSREEYRVTEDMQFGGVRINPDNTDEHFAVFSTSGKEGGARSRVVIPLSLEEDGGIMHIKGVPDLTEDTAFRLARETAKAEKKKTGIVFAGKEYVFYPDGTRGEGSIAVEQGSAEWERQKQFARNAEYVENRRQEEVRQSAQGELELRTEDDLSRLNSEMREEIHETPSETIETESGENQSVDEVLSEGKSAVEAEGVPSERGGTETAAIPQAEAVKTWTDPETGWLVKADPETGELSASVKKGAQIDIKDARALRERAIANYKKAHPAQGKTDSDTAGIGNKLAMTGGSENSGAQERLLEIAREFLSRKLPAGLAYDVKENPDLPAGVRGQFDPITKAIEVKNLKDIKAVVHEMLHQFYLTLTDAEIAGFKKLFKVDPADRVGAEAFADNALDYISRNDLAEIEARSPIRKALQKITDFLRNLWDALVEFAGGVSKADIDGYFHDVFGRNTERKGYNAKLTEALSLNLQQEIAKTVSVRGINSALFTSSRAQAGAQTVLVNGIPLSETSQRDQIKTFQDAYQHGQNRKAELEGIVDWLMTSPPVSAITGNEFQKSAVNIITRVESYFKSIGSSVEHAEIGTVYLTKRGIKSSIGHGLGREKSAAFQAVPDIIKYGKISDRQTNWKGRGYDTYVIDAPIKIGVEDYIGEAVITKDKDGQRFYLHEVEIKAKAQSAFKTGMITSAPQASKLIIAQRLEEVKQKYPESKNLSELFSLSDKRSEADQGTVWKRIASILGAWAEGSAFASGNLAVLSDGRVVSNKEIMDFLAPAVEAGLVTSADMSKIIPLYMEDKLPGASEEDIAFGAKVFDEVTGKYLMDSAFAARGVYSGFNEAYAEFKRLVLGDKVVGEENLGVVETYFRSFFDNYETLRAKRDADGMVDSVSENAGTAGKVTLSGWVDFINSESGLDEILKTVAAQEEALTKDSFTADERERERALNSFLFPQMKRALQALQAGRAVPDSLKGMIRGTLASRLKRDVFKNLYGVLSGDERYISNEDAIADMMGAAELSSAVISRLMRKWSFSEAVSEILGSRLKEGSREEITRREAELGFDVETLETEIAGYEAEIGEEYKGGVTGYREELVKAAKAGAEGKDVNSEEFKKFREQLIRQIFELREFEGWREKLGAEQVRALGAMAKTLQEKMSVDARRSLRAMSEAVINLQRVRAQEGAVRDLKQMTDKLYYSIFKPVSSDVDVNYADAVLWVQTVLGSRSLEKYLGNLYGSVLSLEATAKDYLALFFPFQTILLL